MHRFAILAVLSTAGLGALPAPARAGTATGTIPVSLEVVPTCRVETAALAFSATPGSGSDAQTPIAVACSSDTVVSIALDGGRNGDGAQRRLAGSDGVLVPYRIFTDETRTRQWDGQPVAASVTAAQPLELVAYGRIDSAASLVPAGSYSDTVTVTIAF